jgi:hypothetical protein
MPELERKIWVAPLVALLSLLVSAGCWWWQIRRDRKKGVTTPPKDSWLDTFLIMGACILPVVSLSLLKDDREGGAEPILALPLASAALVCQAFMATKIKGRVEMGVALFSGAAMSCGAIVYSIVKLSR